jgi:hypothetical protein
MLLLSNCKPSLNEISPGKIKIIERNEIKYFKGIQARTLRNSMNQDQIDMEVTIDSVFGNAIIQVRPKHIIYDNFPPGRDSIHPDLLSIIDSLQFRGIHNSGDKIQLEYWYKDDYVVLFRRNPYARHVVGEVNPLIGD